MDEDTKVQPSNLAKPSAKSSSNDIFGTTDNGDKEVDVFRDTPVRYLGELQVLTSHTLKMCSESDHHSFILTVSLSRASALSTWPWVHKSQNEVNQKVAASRHG